MVKSGEVVFEYDKDYDLLYFRKRNDSLVAGTINIGDLTFDVGSDGEILGIEIDNASKIIGVSQDVLAGISSPKMAVFSAGNAIGVRYSFISNNNSNSIVGYLPRTEIEALVN